MAVCTSSVRIEVEEDHLSTPVQGKGGWRCACVVKGFRVWGGK